MSENKQLISRRAVLASAGAAAAATLVDGQTNPSHAAAEMLGPSRPSHYRFKLGEFEVTTILDGAIQVPTVNKIFGQDQKAEDVAALMGANHLPGDKMEIGFTPVVVNTGKEVVLFDSGNGAARRPKAGNLLVALKQAGYAPEEIDAVVITHFHPDHIGGLMEDGKPAFPNARYVAGEVEYNFWTAADQAEGRVGKLANSNVKPLAAKMAFVKPEQEASPGITAIDAFGHTPGHMGYHIESGNGRLILMADACNHYVASMQRPDWHVKFDMDKAAAAATRKKILDMAAADKVAIAGYHMPFPSVGFVERRDIGYHWVPVSYQFNL